MFFKISPLSFHTSVTRIEMALPLSDSYSDMSVVQLCPHLNQPMFQLLDICHLYTFSCMILQKEYSTGFKSGESRGYKSRGMRPGVSAHCRQQLD